MLNWMGCSLEDQKAVVKILEDYALERDGRIDATQISYTIKELMAEAYRQGQREAVQE